MQEEIYRYYSQAGAGPLNVTSRGSGFFGTLARYVAPIARALLATRSRSPSPLPTTINKQRGGRVGGRSFKRMRR